MARQLINLNLEQLEKLGALQCTYDEAAAWFGVSRRTFATKMTLAKYREAWDRGQLKGRISLRRTQFQLAKKSAGMAIWLGKNYLGQKDLQQIEHTGADGRDLFDAIRVVVDGRIE